jgi:FtsP/CotA-like multicopper oxidase with cupredoxin domain
MKYQTRRGFLTAGGGAFAALALSGIGCGSDDDDVEPTKIIEDTPQYTLDVVFADITFDTKFFGAVTARLRTYNGKLPGPPIFTHPGDTLKILVRNSLSKEPEVFHHEWMKLPKRLKHLVPHMLNTTNLHVHGIETVPHLFQPLGTSEPTSPMIAIEPGGELHYSFPIPEDHAPGLYWYHPHHHGSTAVQVLSGMAGGLIVKGAIDEVPEIKAAQDIPIVVQDVALFRPNPESQDQRWSYNPLPTAVWETFQETVANSSVIGAILLKDATGKILQVQDPDGKQYTGEGLPPDAAHPLVVPYLGSGFSTGDLPLRLFLVNGSLVYEETHNTGSPLKPLGHQHGAVPRYTAHPGEVVRFRFLNGCSENMIPLVVEGHDIHVIAMDGVNFPAPRKRKMVLVNKDPVEPQVLPQALANAQVILGSGNRVEFLVKASSKPGVYGIWQSAHTGQFLQSDAKLLAEIEILDKEPKDMPLPTTLPTSSRHYPLMPNEKYKQRLIVFGMVFPAQYNKVIGLDFFMTDNVEVATDLAKLSLPATWEETDISGNGNKGLAYMDERVDLTLKAGDIEEWTIIDNGHLGNTPPGMSGPGSQEGHPFHLHETSFEVIKIDDVSVPLEERTIQDTVWVPHGKSVTIRMRFRENAVGKSVTHCHIIPHEDSGMMMNILVKP